MRTEPDALGTHQGQASLLRQAPSMAALLCIFPVGVLADRWGARRIITLGSLVFTVGSALVLAAPVFGVAAAGLVVQSVGESMILVAALGALCTYVDDPQARGAAFSTFAAVNPVIYVVAPIIAAAVLGPVGWRGRRALRRGSPDT